MSRYITDLAKLSSLIGNIAKRGQSMDKDVHVAALSAVKAFEDHGNVFYINSIYKALGKGARHVALTHWLLAFGGVQANKGKGKKETPFIKDPSKQVDLESAAKAPWHSFKKSPEPDAEIDFLKLALNLLKREPKEGQTVLNQEVKDAIAEAVKPFLPVDETVEAEETGEEDTYALSDDEALALA